MLPRKALCLPRSCGSPTFQIHLTGRESSDGHVNAPVVRGNDEHGIDVLIERFALINMSRGYAVGQLPDSLMARRITICKNSFLTGIGDDGRWNEMAGESGQN
jgi:hypothetical protein